MIERRYLERFALTVLAMGSFAFFAYQSIEFEPRRGDTRSHGGLEDVIALAERDDLNVLFVLIDTLRADRMSAYGYDRETTPFLAELSKSGIRFDDHLAQSSWTKSSMASMWTGLYPIRTGVTKFDHVLSDQAEMPAEILSQAGYRTVGLYRNGWVNGYFGFDQGFDHYYRPMGQTGDRDLQRLRPNELAHAGDEELIGDATEFLRINGKRRPWLVYLHLMDLHEYTYDDQSALFGSAPSDIYDNSLRRTDWLVSELHAFLGEEGLLENTLFVVLSDHGEAFGERGFEGHARAVFPETTRTPLIVGLPFRLDSGLVIRAPTTNLDVWPTVLDLIGVRVPENIDGHSRRTEIVEALGAPPEGLRKEGSASEVQFAYLDENWGRPDSERKAAISVVDGGLRYVSGSDAAGMRFEAVLSDVDGYATNRIEEHEETASRLRDAATGHLGVEPLFAPDSLELDEMQLDQLRALGYQLP